MTIMSWSVENNFEGSSHLFDVLFLYLPEETEENHRTPEDSQPVGQYETGTFRLRSRTLGNKR